MTIDIEKMKALAARLRYAADIADDGRKPAKSDFRRESADAIDSLLSELEAREADRLELVALMPGPYYMDPPDGGDVSVIEQLRRMAKDAERYRELQADHRDFDVQHWEDASWKSISGHRLDMSIDAALAQRQEGEEK
ncbi:hypothetical protein LL999_23175 [Burkholderia ambifaria]|uniref:hypothetical protein n=1 Tax=Burkholderia ambifaria TaxID=152480 RepID=UPI001E3EA3CE|nr:hypothetical protein [Burkholderia ambifaria]UEP23149.1 hypothetical protein LL999_23175 [Burkholderia ambifaria]